MSKKNKLGKSVDYLVSRLFDEIKDNVETQALNYDLAYVPDTSAFIPFLTEAETPMCDNIRSACVDALRINSRVYRNWAARVG